MKEVYFQRMVMASPASLQLSIELSMSEDRSLGGNPAIKVNSRPPVPASSAACYYQESNKRIKRGSWAGKVY